MKAMPLLATIFCLAATPALPQNIVNVFPAPTGLKHKDIRGAPGNEVDISRTSPGANWSVAFPSIPDKLGPIVGNGTGNRWGSATYEANGSLILEQHGANLPCTRLYGSGARLVDEFDGFVSPPRIAIKDAAPLSDLQSAVLNGTVVAWYSGPTDLACRMNVVVPMDALTLWDKKTRSVLFYQMKLGAFAGGLTMSLTSKPPRTGWFTTGRSQQTGQGQTWGFDDSAQATLHGNLMQNGVPLTYSIDILPRLEAVIADGGRYGMDTDPADWVINAEYIGSSLFGHVDIKTEWSNLSLLEAPKSP